MYLQEVISVTVNCFRHCCFTKHKGQANYINVFLMITREKFKPVQSLLALYIVKC
jgi:hypothetical protein